MSVVCVDASSEELEEEIQTVTRALSGAIENEGLARGRW